MKTIFKLFIMLFPLISFFSCEKEEFKDNEMVGLWQQVSVTEDGVPVSLTPQQQCCQLLIDANGAYRCYHQSFKSYNNGNGPTTFYGSWNITDGKWVNFSADKWQLIAPLTSDSSKVVLVTKMDTNNKLVIDTAASVQKQWAKYHIPSRFTILNLSDNEMEIRIKTFVGEKKYNLLFAPDPADFIELKKAKAGAVNYIPKLVTDQNYWIISNELQTLKTYVFKFKKESY
ncbi:hypothetical protein [uncultured Bacteroides sp.]|uniref:hypothetical protein n=1 Tax=uncultured Bacteroides sp. TaxID=162156 RepID=UPI002AAAB5EA|nr:hypothetical protein [uncultured Bacteroides sp.]